ncbi:MAG: hypothetical protein Fur0046_19840 [Cyanobacteria bacterium J069]
MSREPIDSLNNPNNLDPHFPTDADSDDLFIDEILIVDDAPDNLRVLSAILARRGFKVRKALGGSSAIASAQANPPNLILLDVRMPEMDGYAVCQVLKDDPLTSQIPIIFISALNDVSDKLRAFNMGGVDYIIKPFQEAEVLARVETQIRLQKLQQKLIQRNHELLDSNRELEQFAYAVSHDLQQPLQNMMGFAKLLLLKHQSSLDETSLEYLDGILESGRRSQHLIQDLLSYAQVQYQNQSLETVDCTLILETVLENLKGVRVTFLVEKLGWRRPRTIYQDHDS